MAAAIHTVSLPTLTSLLVAGLSIHEAYLVLSYLAICMQVQKGLRSEERAVLANAKEVLQPHLAAQWETYSDAMRTQIVRHLRKMHI
jgi:hypothetical protein